MRRKRRKRKREEEKESRRSRKAFAHDLINLYFSAKLELFKIFDGKNCVVFFDVLLLLTVLTVDFSVLIQTYIHKSVKRS